VVWEVKVFVRPPGFAATGFAMVSQIFQKTKADPSWADEAREASLFSVE